MVGNPGTRERATEARGHGHNKRRSLGEVTIITAKNRHLSEAPPRGDAPHPMPHYVRHGVDDMSRLRRSLLNFNNLNFLCGSARVLLSLRCGLDTKRQKRQKKHKDFICLRKNRAEPQNGIMTRNVNGASETPARGSARPRPGVICTINSGASER